MQNDTEADREGVVSVCLSEEAFLSNAFSGPVILFRMSGGVVTKERRRFLT